MDPVCLKGIHHLQWNLGFLEDSISAGTSNETNWAEDVASTTCTTETVNNPPSVILMLFIILLQNKNNFFKYQIHTYNIFYIDIIVSKNSTINKQFCHL